MISLSNLITESEYNEIHKPFHGSFDLSNEFPELGNVNLVIYYRNPIVQSFVAEGHFSIEVKNFPVLGSVLPVLAKKLIEISQKYTQQNFQEFLNDGTMHVIGYRIHHIQFRYGRGIFNFPTEENRFEMTKIFMESTLDKSFTTLKNSILLKLDDIDNLNLVLRNEYVKAKTTYRFLRVGSFSRESHPNYFKNTPITNPQGRFIDDFEYKLPEKYFIEIVRVPKDSTTVTGERSSDTYRPHIYFDFHNVLVKNETLTNGEFVKLSDLFPTKPDTSDRMMLYIIKSFHEEGIWINSTDDVFLLKRGEKIR